MDDNYNNNDDACVERIGNNLSELGNVPTPQKHRITIDELDRGYIVNVGCKSFCFTELDEMLEAVDDYLSDRKTIEKMFESGELFNDKN